MKRYEKTPERRARARAQYRKHHDARRDAANLKYDLDPEYRERMKAYAAKRRTESADRVAAEKAVARALPENREYAAQKTREWRQDNPEHAQRLDRRPRNRKS